MLDEVASISDPILRAETAAEIMEAARLLRDDSIREAATTMSTRQISSKIGLGKSTVNQIVRAGG